ncbi:MAG: T9SS type A sorting domain-containing protein, partial [Ignavibacteria bacterium]|nr:T9SS type A sorting domain-containing protein [Ignavibacteria bacterium]
QINTNTGSDAMGGATIVIGFDTSVTTFKSNPIKNTDYIIHNFCSGNYSPATITRPMSNKIWVNIDLPFNNSNNGTIVAGSENWTDVATIHFDIINQQGLANFLWITNSTFWGVYDDDNITLWNTGQFEDHINYPIPVELSSFTASLLNNNFVQLRWITITSLNNYGFEIERKVGSLQSTVSNYEKIGFVESIGNSTSPDEYSFTDVTKHNSSVVYYRLKIIDMDGTFTYSDVVEVETGPISFELAQNYPNPFNPSTKISWQSPVGSRQTIKVYDVLGNEVVTLVDEYRTAGSYEVDFQSGSVGGQQLASGIYIYRLSAGNFTETKKMVLLR